MPGSLVAKLQENHSLRCYGGECCHDRACLVAARLREGRNVRRAGAMLDVILNKEM